jgi:hypothetical protein
MFNRYSFESDKYLCCIFVTFGVGKEYKRKEGGEKGIGEWRNRDEEIALTRREEEECGED